MPLAFTQEDFFVKEVILSKGYCITIYLGTLSFSYVNKEKHCKKLEKYKCFRL